jgi:hypothetical protein
MSKDMHPFNELRGLYRSVITAGLLNLKGMTVRQKVLVLSLLESCHFKTKTAMEG